MKRFEHVTFFHLIFIPYEHRIFNIITLYDRHHRNFHHRTLLKADFNQCKFSTKFRSLKIYYENRPSTCMYAFHSNVVTCKRFYPDLISTQNELKSKHAHMNFSILFLVHRPSSLSLLLFAHMKCYNGRMKQIKSMRGCMKSAHPHSRRS